MPGESESVWDAGFATVERRFPPRRCFRPGSSAAARHRPACGLHRPSRRELGSRTNRARRGRPAPEFDDSTSAGRSAAGDGDTPRTTARTAIGVSTAILVRGSHTASENKHRRPTCLPNWSGDASPAKVGQLWWATGIRCSCRRCRLVTVGGIAQGTDIRSPRAEGRGDRSVLTPCALASRTASRRPQPRRRRER